MPVKNQEILENRTESGIEVRGLTVEYRMGKKAFIRAVDNVSLNIPGGGYTLGLVGESGSGKTSLGMSIVNSIEPPGWITAG